MATITITVAAACASVTLASTVIAALGPIGVKANQVLTATDFTDTETITIDSKVYILQDTLTNVDGNVFITGDASATAELQVVGQPGNTETVTIDSKVYMFQTVLTNVDGNIQIAGTTALTRANLVKAINLTGLPGSDYAVNMTIHPTFSAVDTDPNVDVTYKVAAGKIGNGISVNQSVTGWNWTAGTTAGGTTDVDETIINLEAALDLGTGSGSKYAASMTVHPTVENKAFTASTWDVRHKTTGTAGNSVDTLEAGAAMSWAAATLTGGVVDPTYSALDITALAADGTSTVVAITDTDKTGSDYIVLPTFFGAAVTAIPKSFYKFTATSTAPVTTGVDFNCATVDCDLACEVYDQVLVNLKRPSAKRTEYHLMYESLQNVTVCEECDCDAHLDIYEVLKRDINNPTLLDEDDCGCS